MEKKYPVLKCNEELWAEIKPVLESFGVTDFSGIGNSIISKFDEYPFLISNYGRNFSEEFCIGNIDVPEINEYGSLRYLVNTKEEFLSAVAKLLGKEYPIKEEKQVNEEIKYPSIKFNPKIYIKIKDIINAIGYSTECLDKFSEYGGYLAVNKTDVFGNMPSPDETPNTYLCSNVREFLIKACELKGFEVSYVDFVGDGDAENHYFDYRITKENTNEIYITENLIIESSQANKKESFDVLNNKEKIIAPEPIAEWDFSKAKGNIIPNSAKKKFKKKKENYVVSHDPAVGESSTVVAAIPPKGNDFDKDKGSDLDIDKNKDIEKINIVDKLRYCKKGTKLYSPLFGEVEFNNIVNNKIYVITCNTSEIDFCKDGRYSDMYPDSECLLFPSKDNRDWNNFQVLEEGHRVMCSDNGNCWSLCRYANNDAAKASFGSEINTYWNYIVPVEDFDFTAEDITINKEKSIV